MDGEWDGTVWAEAALKFPTAQSDIATNPCLALGQSVP